MLCQTAIFLWDFWVPQLMKSQLPIMVLMLAIVFKTSVTAVGRRVGDSVGSISMGGNGISCSVGCAISGGSMVGIVNGQQRCQWWWVEEMVEAWQLPEVGGCNVWPVSHLFGLTHNWWSTNSSQNPTHHLLYPGCIDIHTCIYIRIIGLSISSTKQNNSTLHQSNIFNKSPLAPSAPPIELVTPYWSKFSKNCHSNIDCMTSWTITCL